MEGLWFVAEIESLGGISASRGFRLLLLRYPPGFFFGSMANKYQPKLCGTSISTRPRPLLLRDVSIVSFSITCRVVRGRP